MNAAQLHLALTHVPVVLCITGLAILLLTLLRKNFVLSKTALWVLVVAGCFSLPVYFSGEGAEEMVENLTGVAKQSIEPHEELAKIALILVLATAATSLAALVFAGKEKWFTDLRFVALLLALGAAGVLFQTAHLGGAIRHPEIKGSAQTVLPAGVEKKRRR